MGLHLVITVIWTSALFMVMTVNMERESVVVKERGGLNFVKEIRIFFVQSKKI